MLMVVIKGNFLNLLADNGSPGLYFLREGGGEAFFFKFLPDLRFQNLVHFVVCAGGDDHLILNFM